MEAQQSAVVSNDALSPEEELLLLELEEEERLSREQPEETAASIAELPEDVWSVHRSGSGSSPAGAIRFAEDIDELRGGVTGRRERRNSSRNQNSKKGQNNSRRRR